MTAYVRSAPAVFHTPSFADFSEEKFTLGYALLVEVRVLIFLRGIVDLSNLLGYVLYSLILVDSFWGVQVSCIVPSCRL